jgi:D-3-phosphoglycerate dehydrogenase
MSDNRRCVLVPSTMDRAGTDLLAARPDIETITYPVGLAGPPFHDLLARADGIALSVTPFGAAEMAAAPRLAVVARIGVGFDAVEIPALTARGVPLMTTGTANSTSVAEAALTMLLTLAKRHTLMDGIVRGGDWGARFATPPMEVEGKTVLVVGYGRIGARTAAKCAALGMRVLVHDPLVPAEAITRAGHTAAPDLDAALPGATFVTLHCPKSPATIGLFGARRLALMAPGAFLINTARGGIVDEAALYAALVSGHLGGAGLDVFDQEPTPRDNPLLSHPGLICAPHMAGVTAEALAAMSAATARNILSVLDGAPIRDNVVNAEVLTASAFGRRG